MDRGVDVRSDSNVRPFVGVGGENGEERNVSRAAREGRDEHGK
jgi:hypothetical protein